MPETKNSDQHFSKFAHLFGLAVSCLVFLPTLLAFLLRPDGFAYLGFQYNFDDHMVYASWMRQAMEGSFLFENRFTTDAQPGLTLNIYFLFLGNVARLVGIPIAMLLARLGFTYLSVILLARLIKKVASQVYARKVALTLAVLGSGIGFMVWHNFGVAISKPVPLFLQTLMLSRLPTDVWQAEGFFLPSALTNGLFMVSLCLILAVLNFIIESKDSKRAVLWGAICFGMLMNIHSYDVLLIGLTMVPFVGAQLAARKLDSKWALRGLTIAIGVVPFAFYFVYVLRNDPVFQARAATETFSPNFRSIIAGNLGLIILGFFALPHKTLLQKLGIALLFVQIGALSILAAGHLQDGYFLTPSVWGLTFAVSVAICVLLSSDSVGSTLVISWAVIGLVAPYFPALFQRKLTMMLAIPWGILAGLAIANFLEKRERGQRNLLTVFVTLVVAATGFQWINREITLAKSNVSNTTVHSVYLSPDIQEIIRLLQPLGRNAVIAAIPGIPNPAFDETNSTILDRFSPPVIFDLNPVMVGLAGSRAYAGHWSETPNYRQRRSEINRAMVSPKAATLLRSYGVTHAIFPTSDHNPAIDTSLQVTKIYQGKEFILLKL
jgi:hypothetical protein